MGKQTKRNFKPPGSHSTAGPAGTAKKGKGASELLDRALFQNAKLAKTVDAEFAGVAARAGRYPLFAAEMRDYHTSLTSAVQQNSRVLRKVLGDKRKRPTADSVRVAVSLTECIGSSYNSAEKVWAHLVKDWTVAMPKEWGAMYARIAQYLNTTLAVVDSAREGLPLVLVPGCAQGRLVFEIAQQVEAEVRGVEASRMQLLVADYIWNQCAEVDELMFHPYVDEAANNLQPEARAMACTAPAVAPQHFPETMRRVAFEGGDFLRMSLPRGQAADAVVTCFFVDCFDDVVACLEHIYKLLKPGGLWVNVGPLEYHGTQCAPTLKHLVTLAQEIGFSFEQGEGAGKDPWSVHPLPYFTRPQALRNFQIQEAAMCIATKKR